MTEKKDQKMKYGPGKIIKEFDVDENNVLFRVLKPTDTEQALKYINTLIKERVNILWQKPFTMKQEKEWVKGELKKNKEGNSINVVVEINRRMVGVGHVSRKLGHARQHVCEVGLSLSKDIRGFGIGKELMNVLCKLGADVLECTIADLDVYDCNDVAKSLYKKLGFREYGRIPNGLNHYGHCCDHLFMYKELKK